MQFYIICNSKYSLGSSCQYLPKGCWNSGSDWCMNQSGGSCHLNSFELSTPQMWYLDLLLKVVFLCPSLCCTWLLLRSFSFLLVLNGFMMMCLSVDFLLFILLGKFWLLVYVNWCLSLILENFVDLFKYLFLLNLKYHQF